ncbi:hypothetical protein QQS21_005213 [Conoideocrella luteorostrata]|uniref:2EXR domain-containing protein n=1 Tax=Conoideocrella luteorostrata TaxID=1105319 RepID=A0AAJ0CQX0_9HYPO|nr:hypothetical protein QQS21_005213 [Conoideocrella luteorostrata]
MALTFTLFPRLPIELRYMVWELALRPFLSHRGGINYVSGLLQDDEYDVDANSLDVTRSFLGPKEWYIDRRKPLFLCNRVQKDNVSTASHKSACLWDSGLLTACEESRHVIMKRYEKYEQNEPHFFLGNDEDDYRTFETKSVTQAQGRDENWHLLCQPIRDLTCFTFLNMEVLHDGRYGYETPRIYECNFMEFEPILALEFDASWALNWPDFSYDIFHEASPRGLIARLLRHHIDYPDLGVCSIWLIDRKAPPEEVSGSRETPCMTFYDMEQDYIEPEVPPVAISEFIEEIDDLIQCWDFHADVPQIQNDESETLTFFHWDINKYVRTLVRSRGEGPQTKSHQY